jgi:hypothetical protein
MSIRTEVLREVVADATGIQRAWETDMTVVVPNELLRKLIEAARDLLDIHNEAVAKQSLAFSTDEDWARKMAAAAIKGGRRK